MAFSTLGDLKAKLSRELFHTRFAPDYEDAIKLFESSTNRRLRVRQMEGQRTITISTGTGAAPIPADYLVWRTVLWIGATPMVEIDYVHPAYLDSTVAGTDGGNPRIFTIEGSTFYTRPVNPAGGNIFQFHYYQKIPTITGSDLNTNWLLTEYPDAYLFGALVELFTLGRNVEGAQLYKARRDETFAEIIQLSALTTGATSSQVRQAEYF